MVSCGFLCLSYIVICFNWIMYSPQNSMVSCGFLWYHVVPCVVSYTAPCWTYMCSRLHENTHCKNMCSRAGEKIILNIWSWKLCSRLHVNTILNIQSWKRCSRLHENACFWKMAFSCKRKHLFHDCLFPIVKNPWGNKETKQIKCGDQWELETIGKTKKQDVDTNGG